MQTELIETFLDLAETRSFHRSAERLGVTQSTISARLQALETAIGARLFDRSRSGTTLTTEGKRFEPHARSLRHEWNEARRRIQIPAGAGHLLRLGIQNDLSAVYLGEQVAEIRRQFPDIALYIEPDYSNQMCLDLLTGVLDFAVMFSPKPHPDLHFESVGDAVYRMISTGPDQLEQIRPERFIFSHFSPAFEEMHRQLTPQLAISPISVGQSGSVTSLLLSMGGAGYVLEVTAQELIQAGRVRAVSDAPVLRQPVFAAMHIRHRITPLHRKLSRIVSRQLAGRAEGQAG
ncbi:LysR family transcriptional regulator [Pseudogemmobacter faecipullorum]|uniref:LysR family transcriptional regulator n=1 Tax=Pseudogemmobacter faecipullorum TaxID=2755041 RepID=A0ABS8CK65_9RHOB|nr:LysR family transcriptional regulator [Pseudogemmobacter faecipullorum]MCB5409788.1 LysR family transcriptional regulator [Pseudogemmobacter faecipullorum]